MLGLAVALASGWVAVDLRDRFSPVPTAEKAGGMYGFGDFLLGIAVAGLVALVPLGLGLYWLRPLEKFWRWLSRFGIAWALSGFVALAINHWSQPPVGLWTLLGNIRFGLMPLTSLALLSCALFAPLPQHRRLLAAAAAVDGVTFVAVVLLKFVLA